MTSPTDTRDALIYSDSKNGADMRAAVGVVVSDPFLFAEKDGRGCAVITGFEVPRLQQAGIQAFSLEELGLDGLLREGLPRSSARLEVLARACERLGIQKASVPPNFPLELAEKLRGCGVDVLVNRTEFERRRRSKSAREVAGVQRALGAVEAALTRVGEMLASATTRSGDVFCNGERLTSELVKELIEAVYSERGVLTEDMIVAHGAQIYGHDAGSGPIALGEPIVIDLAPRDPDTGCFADMTRTFVVGEPDEELRGYQRLVRRALELAADELTAGTRAQRPYEVVCDWFHAKGFDTEMSKREGAVLKSGFFHGLGHGVGLEVHEPPFLHRSDDVLAEGDVVSVEPGLYREGYGGCRLEDMFLITSGKPRRLSTLGYELRPWATVRDSDVRDTSDS